MTDHAAQLQQETPEVQHLVKSLGLAPHVEGGYFRRTYTAATTTTTPAGERPINSSIYYLLTEQQPIGFWHRNRSDILHFFHCGDVLTYWLLDPSGKLQHVTLGADLAAGEQPQLLVPGGYWKATALGNGSYGLVSESVTPGFDYSDMELADEGLLEQHPEHRAAIEPLLKP